MTQLHLCQPLVIILPVTYGYNLTQAKHHPSPMSKAPPPVLPKPSRSTPAQVKTGIGSVTMVGAVMKKNILFFHVLRCI